MSSLRHIGCFDANTGLLSIGGESAFTGSLLDFALDFGSHSSGNLVPHAVEMGRTPAKHFRNEFCSSIFSVQYG